MGWAPYSNGQLLDEAEKAAFDAVVTCDQKPSFQQNLTGRNIAVVILSTNIWPIIAPSPRGYSAPWPTPSRDIFNRLLRAASADSGQLPIEARKSKFSVDPAVTRPGL
jgi:hypothetical protein